MKGIEVNDINLNYYEIIKQKMKMKASHSHDIQHQHQQHTPKYANNDTLLMELDYS